MFDGIEDGARLKLIDPNGKLILQEKLIHLEFKIPENLSPGLYWLNIESNSVIENKKIIVR
jgi:hypothetical protein